MGKEIERKFLIANKNWKQEADAGKVIKQGYLNTNKERTVRVRLIGEKGILTIKGKNIGITRSEFEYKIPQTDALELLKICEQPIIEKVRYIVKKGDHNWEIDIFEGDNQGLEVAEIELSDENEEVDIPNWIGEEVSGIRKYYNSSLVNLPYSKWNKS